MKQSNIDFLEENYSYWITLRDAEYMRGLNSHQLEGMVRVMREEFIPGYICDTWCPACVAEMVKSLYTKYDAWKAARPKEEVIPVEAPIMVSANFPSHKPEQEIRTPSTNQKKRNHRR